MEAEIGVVATLFAHRLESYVSTAIFTVIFNTGSKTPGMLNWDEETEQDPQGVASQ